MIRSMTGFGKGEGKDSIRHFTVEIKSVNNRYNDIIIRMPKHLSYIEDKIKKIIKNKISRGRIEVYINLEYIGDSDIEVKVDVPLAQSYSIALKNLTQELELNDNLSLDLVSRFPDVIKTIKKEEDEDEIWNCVYIAVNDALDNLLLMRTNEGEELAKDIKKIIEKIEDKVNYIKKRTPEVVREYREKLWNRIEELLENKFELDENRLMNEVAIFADKSDINEEIIRLNSHIIQMKETLEVNEPVGRKLDFMIQEMNREINTIGSKVGDIEITNSVINIKSELERIREQVQNIE